jgi:hypothetical protein
MSDFDNRSKANKHAFLAGKTGQGGGVAALVAERLEDLEREHLQRDGGNDPQRGESSTGE